MPYRTPTLAKRTRTALDWSAVVVLVLGCVVIGTALAGLWWVCAA